MQMPFFFFCNPDATRYHDSSRSRKTFVVVDVGAPRRNAHGGDEALSRRAMPHGMHVIRHRLADVS